VILRDKENRMLIFTDAATSSKCGIAIGAFLFLEQRLVNEYAGYSNEELFRKISERVVYKKYFSKKSTWSEIRTVIDALQVLEENIATGFNVEVYTDCQSLCDLLTRRKAKLEQSNFITRSGKVLANAELYKELFAVTNKFRLSTFKLKGHTSVSHRLTLPEKIFAILDKSSRKELRAMVEEMIAKQ
jgi:ribonuclease HI